MVAQQLKKFLEDNGVRYVTVIHSPAYTAQQVAASAHVPGKDLAKTVVVKLNGKLAMAVLPASCHVDLELLRDATGTDTLELADEHDFADAFPGCEIGAMPPFGNLYGLDVYVDESLTFDDEIAFNAGSHTWLVKLSYADFERLVRPTVVRFSAQMAV